MDCPPIDTEHTRVEYVGHVGQLTAKQTQFSMKTAFTARLRVLTGLSLGSLLVTTAIGAYHLPALNAQTEQGRWLRVERVAGDVTFRAGGSQAAQVGDRLTSVGHGIVTGAQSSASLTIDSGIGSLAVAQNTQMTVQQLSIRSDGARVTILDVPQGQVRSQVRSLTNPNSRLELHTPSGVAAVRGTEFGVAVAQDGKTSIGTLEGQVEATAQSVVVPVEGGFASIVYSGEPPTPARPLDRELAIQWQTQERRGRQLYLSGRIDAANTLLQNGEVISISRTGYFEVVIASARSDRSTVLIVQNPMGESRAHSIFPWQIPNS
ncbi:MAG: FecR family protein, partial [Cyanobacteria bacterium J06626_14]